MPWVPLLSGASLDSFCHSSSTNACCSSKKQSATPPQHLHNSGPSKGSGDSWRCQLRFHGHRQGWPGLLRLKPSLSGPARPAGPFRLPQVPGRMRSPTRALTRQWRRWRPPPQVVAASWACPSNAGLRKEDVWKRNRKRVAKSMAKKTAGLDWRFDRCCPHVHPF